MTSVVADRRDLSAPRSRIPALPALLCAVSLWLLCLPRMIPSLAEDRGVFVSVAERLIAGDRLYVDVWDNKDPFFYYAIATGRIVSPYADLVIEVLYVLVACVGIRSIASTVGCSPSWAFFCGYGLTPLVLTGAMYSPGYSHLPGIALTAVALACAFAGRSALFGAALGALCVFKLVMLPPAVLAVVVILILRRRSGLQRSAIAFVSILASAAVVLLLRGEIGPYIASLISNVSYAHSSLLDPRVPPIVGHLLRVNTRFADMSASTTIAVVAVCAPAALRSRSSADGVFFVLWLCVLVTFAASLAVLSVTGLWPQHDQILLVPALLAAVAVIARFGGRGSRGGPRARVLATSCVAVAVLLSGPSPRGFVDSMLDAPGALRDLGMLSPESQALRERASAGTYARVGQNDDLGHATGLRSWALECPRFHQYPFDPPTVLEATSACLAKAQFIIVSRSASPVISPPSWNLYLQRVHRLLRQDYVCTAAGSGQLCERR